MHCLPDDFYLGLSLRRFYDMDRKLASGIHHLRIDVNADTTACIKAHVQALGYPEVTCGFTSPSKTSFYGPDNRRLPG